MNDTEVLDQFLREVSPTIEELVTQALRQGRALQHMAILLERAFDGSVRGGCGSRREIASKLGLDQRLAAEQRQAITSAMAIAGDDVPVVLVIHGEGHLTVGIRRLPGALVAIS